MNDDDDENYFEKKTLEYASAYETFFVAFFHFNLIIKSNLK